jgi:hypothetical protein
MRHAAVNSAGPTRSPAWDPRKDSGDYAFFRIVVDRLQAWRQVNELAGRTLMRGGEWLA